MFFTFPMFFMHKKTYTEISTLSFQLWHGYLIAPDVLFSRVSIKINWHLTLDTLFIISARFTKNIQLQRGCFSASMKTKLSFKIIVSA